MRNKNSSSRKNYIIIFSLVFVCHGTVTAQTGIDTGLANTLQRAIDSLQVAYNVKGISAAAYIPGKGLWKGVAGVSYAGVPIDTSMLMSIGSVTKTFVATEIMKLADAGQISLDDTVGALLPPMTDVNGAITVRQLLSHTSGMGDFVNSSWQVGMSADLTAIWYYPTALVAFLSPAAGSPGCPMHYCNANYSLLGMIIEAKTGDSLHRVLRNDFLLPYHLGNTHMEIFESYPNTIAHNWATPTLNPALATDASATPHQALWSSVEPAGGYFSDAADMAMWAYYLYSGNVITAASLTDMLTFVPASSSYFNGYGLGVMRFPADGRIYYGHGGNYYGYAASMLYYPVDSISVAVLINQDCIATYEARNLMNILINKIATGINDKTLDRSVSVSPNPVDDQLTISTGPYAGYMHIDIMDEGGKHIYSTDVRDNCVSIDTKQFIPGAYFVQITRDGKTITRQVIIHH